MNVCNSLTSNNSSFSFCCCSPLDLPVILAQCMMGKVLGLLLMRTFIQKRVCSFTLCSHESNTDSPCELQWSVCLGWLNQLSKIQELYGESLTLAMYSYSPGRTSVLDLCLVLQISHHYTSRKRRVFFEAQGSDMFSKSGGGPTKRHLQTDSMQRLWLESCSVDLSRTEKTSQAGAPRNPEKSMRLHLLARAVRDIINQRTIAHAYNPRNQEAEAWGSQIQVHPALYKE